MWEEMRLSLAQMRLSPERVEREAARVATPPAELPENTGKPVCAAASVQFRIFGGLPEYIENLNLYFSKAAAHRAALLVLPEFFQLHALSLIPGFASRAQTRRNKQKNVYDLVKELSEGQLSLLNEITFSAVSAFSRTYHMITVVGAGLMRKNGGLYLRSTVFDANGAVAGCQDKLYRSEECDDSELLLSDRLTVVETPIGGVCVLAGADALDWRSTRAAVEAGAKILAAPMALKQPYESFTAMRDVQTQVQFDYAFGIKACLIGGDEIGLRLQGKALIAAPFKMTPSLNGLLACATAPQKGHVIAAALDMAALEEYTDFYTGK